MNGRIVRTQNDIASRLGMPEAGRLRIGEKRISPKTGKEYPTSLENFKAAGNYATLFHQELGEKPSTIQIIFPSDDASLVCNQEWVMRDNAGKVLAEGDGKDFKVWNGSDRILMSTDQYPNLMESLKSRYGCDWKINLTMRFLVPAVRGVWGYWQLSTYGSASSIPALCDVFDAFYEHNGKVAGVVFDLSVKKVKSGKPGDSSTYPVLTLIPNESAENIAKVKGWLKPVAMLNE